jgi:transposase
MEVPSRFEIDDELWAEVQPLIPVRQRRRRYPGRKPLALV